MLERFSAKDEESSDEARRLLGVAEYDYSELASRVILRQGGLINCMDSFNSCSDDRGRVYSRLDTGERLVRLISKKGSIQIYLIG